MFGRKRDEAIELLRDQLRRSDERMSALMERLTASATVAPTEPASKASEALVSALAGALASNERMASHLVGFLTGERERRREQHADAGRARQAKAREERQAELAIVREAAPAAPRTVPDEFLNCENCMAAIENRPSTHNRDLTNHLLMNHIGRLGEFATADAQPPSPNGAPSSNN